MTEPVADLAAEFLAAVCVSYVSDSYGGQHPSLETAARLLAEHPDLPQHSLAVAAAIADAPAVRAHLSAGAKLAEDCGPWSWNPLLYLAFSRWDRADEGAWLATAEVLLEHGADPDAGFLTDHGPPPFTVLTGLFGDGEGSQSSHPAELALAQLILTAGADPNDGQSVYNRMFRPNDDHLRLLFEFGLGQDHHGRWYRELGDQLESPATMLRSLLAWAISHDQQERVRLLITHGVDIASVFTEPRSPRRHTPLEFALVTGNPAVAEILGEAGAPPPQLSAPDQFVAAVMAGDATAAGACAADTIATVRRRNPGLLTWAAAQGAPNSVELLLSYGFDINSVGRSDIPSNDPWHTALHAAAEKNNVELARLLLARGADPTLTDHRFHATALQWAQHLGNAEVAQVFDADVH